MTVVLQLVLSKIIKNRPFFWRNTLTFRAKRRHLLGTASDRTSWICQRTRLGPSFICTEHHRAFIDSAIHWFIPSLSLYLSPCWPFDHSAAFVVGALAAMPSSCPFPSGFWFRGTSFLILNMCLNAGANLEKPSGRFEMCPRNLQDQFHAPRNLALALVGEALCSALISTSRLGERTCMGSLML